MIGDIQKNVLVSFKADLGNLDKALAGVEKGLKDGDKAAKEFKADLGGVERALTGTEKALNSQKSALSRLSAGFSSGLKSIGSDLSSGVGAINTFSKALGPWNQAFELGGKAINFASDALDAYAKTSKSAAAEVASLKGTFTDLKNEVLAFAGGALVKAKNAMGDFMDFATSSSLKDALRARQFRETLISAARGAVGESARNDLRSDWNKLSSGVFGDEWGSGLVGSGLDAFKKGMDEQKKALEDQAKAHDKLAASQKQDAIENARWRAEFLESQRAMQGSNFNDTRYGGTTSDGSVGLGISTGMLDSNAQISKAFADQRNKPTFTADNDELTKWRENMAIQQEALDSLSASFDAFGEAVGAAYEAIVTGSGSVGQAFQKMLADGMLALGKSSALEAIRELALGFGSLAFGPLGGASASMHFKSAALHGAVAVGAGLAAAGLGAGTPGATSATAPSAAPASGGASGGSGKGSSTYNVYLGDPLGEDSYLYRRQRAERAARQLGQLGAWEDS